MIAVLCIGSMLLVLLVMGLAYASLVAEHRRLTDVHDRVLRELEARSGETHTMDARELGY